MKIDGRYNSKLRRDERKKFVLMHYELFELVNKWALTPSWQFFTADKRQNPETIYLIYEVSRLAREYFVYSDTTNDKDITWSLFCLWRTYAKGKRVHTDPITEFFNT